MRYYLAFDDTDVKNSKIGTGRFAREYVPTLGPEWRLYGIIRQQYPQSEAIPFTSNNSSATIIFDHPEAGQEEFLIDHTTKYIAGRFVEGSDPGLCIASETSPALKVLAEFGQICTSRVVTKEEARQAAKGAHLSEHGGTGDGIIGAAAGVGLSAYGWSGRFVELGGCDLRAFGESPTVGELWAAGIKPVCTTRFDMPLHENDVIDALGWIRPRLWAGQAVLPVVPASRGHFVPTNLGEGIYIKLPTA